MWTLLFISINPPVADSANINPKMLDAREHVSIKHSPVNITRSHDGDIIMIKGKKRNGKAEVKALFGFN